MRVLRETLSSPNLTTATKHPRLRRSSRVGGTGLLMAPAIGSLIVWSIVPTVLTLWFSFQGYNLLTPPKGFVGFKNFYFLLTDPGLPTVLLNTLLLVVAPVILTIGLGTGCAIVYNGVFYGRNIARLLVITPFFIMPTVSALVWKNLFMHP